MVMIGTNNAWYSEAKILLLPIFPRGEKAEDGFRKVNAEASERARAALADDPRVVYLDFNAKFLEPDGTLPKAMFPDSLHPNKAGYRLWCDEVLPYFERYAK